MIWQPLRLPYTVAPLSSYPELELELKVKTTSIVRGLVDTGSSVSVLPFSVGLMLGGDWGRAVRIPQIGGAYGGVETRSLLAKGILNPFPEVSLAFAWVKTDNIRVIFGQTNFLREFDVCFFGSLGEFEIRPKP